MLSSNDCALPGTTWVVVHLVSEVVRRPDSITIYFSDWPLENSPVCALFDRTHWSASFPLSSKLPILLANSNFNSVQVDIVLFRPIDVAFPWEATAKTIEWSILIGQFASEPAFTPPSHDNDQWVADAMSGNVQILKFFKFWDFSTIDYVM